MNLTIQLSDGDLLHGPLYNADVDTLTPPCPLPISLASNSKVSGGKGARNKEEMAGRAPQMPPVDFFQD